MSKYDSGAKDLLIETIGALIVYGILIGGLVLYFK